MPVIEKLDGNFGAAIHGVDLAVGVDDKLMRFLTQSLYEHQVIVLRNQKLDEDSYLQFGKQWGDPIPHVLDHMRMAGYPEMMTVGNTERRDRDDGIRNGAALWHTDQSYESVPASATMLYSIKAPEKGGETQFCNMALAYDALDVSVARKIANLHMAHKYGYGKTRKGERNANPIINDDQDQRVPVVHHPVVMPHPITGRKALYALGHGAHAIRGMADDAAEDLIDSLKDHVLQEQFIYRHSYEIGDVVIWDTLSTMHSATLIDIPENQREERLLWRISVRRLPEIFRSTVLNQDVADNPTDARIAG